MKELIKPAASATEMEQMYDAMNECGVNICPDINCICNSRVYTFAEEDQEEIIF